ncbi:putative WD repeat-containing protein [Cyphellophora attinorum]|uniref:Putative WD repeat-containing protein n=1 Tax=Cyphellophora attinorum TaxID=1664694 RepID=A0A0N1HFX4_9EURO|nr:putative WD repeat-containing protein [Phialophora attinorum]KPI44275.1 putative WD repeat-containing protein [Phialophora attinorum]
MSRSFQSVAQCKPSSQADVYIYKIVPVTDSKIAGITSADELFLVDGQLGSGTVIQLPGPPKTISTLVTTSDGNGFICAGGSGDVFLYDVRTRERAGKVNVGKGVTAMSLSGSALAVGTEYVNHQAVVSVWDVRQLSKPQWQNAENHDDITAIDFHPSRTNLLLAGGDDGQVSIFDSTVVEEEDSLVQGLNQGPVHKAGFLDQSSFYALSSDQNLALHPVFDDTRTEEPKPIDMGDVRPLIPCEYVVDIVKSGTAATIATGSHSKSRVDLVAIQPDGNFDLQNRIVLEGAHSEEIVRSIFTSDETGLIYTAGEDGQIQVFREAAGTSETSSRKSKKEGGRYKPY